ncbi:MAG: cbb3-type cytochrome oxidase assembly protein CcoS [Blastocatellia bacterium]
MFEQAEYLLVVPCMEILFILIGFSLMVALFFLGCFFWAVRSGQYEDRYTPSIRILFEERQPQAVTTAKKSEE